MALSDELAKLKDLHERGALTDDEFSRAKARAIRFSTLEAICDELGCQPGDLLESQSASRPSKRSRAA